MREEDFESEARLDARLTMVPFKARTPSSDELIRAEKIVAGEPSPEDQGRQVSTPEEYEEYLLEQEQQSSSIEDPNNPVELIGGRI